MARLSQDPANLLPIIHTPGTSAAARRVQSKNTTGDRPATDEREIGNETLVGTTFDIPAVTVDVEANLVNGKLLAQFANRASGSTWTNASLQSMLGSQDVDLELRQRNDARTSFVQTVYVKQAAIASYRLAASTNASATETFNLTTNNKTAFERFVQVDHFTAVSTSQTIFNLSAIPVALTAGVVSGNRGISVAYANLSGSSTYLLEGPDYSIDSSGATRKLRISGTPAAGIAIGTRVMVAYQRSGSTPGTALDVFSSKDTISPAAIRGYYHIPVTITAANSSRLTRGVQSIEATMNFQPTQEVGMGSQAIAAGRTTPAEVTGTITIFSQDFTEEKLMQKGTLTPNADTVTDYPIDGWRDDIRFKIEFKNPETGAILRTDVLSGCTITNDGKEVRVGSQVGKQYGFRGSAGFTWLNSKNAA